MKSIHEEWFYFRQKMALSRNYTIAQHEDGIVPRSPIVDMLLPGLLLVFASVILDEALKEIILNNGFGSEKHRHTLMGRCKFLIPKGFGSNGQGLTDTIVKRNEVAHENAEISWSQLDPLIGEIEKFLQEAGLVKSIPEFEPYFERSAMRDSSDPKYKFERKVEWGLKVDGKWSVKSEYTSRFG